jgi:hypothetical protein
MNAEILSLRVSRRAIGVAILRSDGLALSDGRHLPSGPTRAVSAATRYLERLLGSSITAVVVDSPARGLSPVTDRLLDSIHEVLSSKRLISLVIGKSEVLTAYGLPALRTRGDVRSVVGAYWPALGRITSRAKPYMVDAAAAALYAECRLALSSPPT